jgi:hypothetical protein
MPSQIEHDVIGRDRDLSICRAEDIVRKVVNARGTDRVRDRVDRGSGFLRDYFESEGVVRDSKNGDEQD